MRFNVGFATDIGRKRQQNQDSGVAIPECNLFVVADGMGGHRGGETASSMAVQLISDFVRKAEKHKDWRPRPVLIDAIRSANAIIYEKSRKQPELSGMGTTTTSLLFSQNLLTIGHVGDSRCYYLRPQSIWQLTRDHSLVQEKLRAGLITRMEARTDSMRNIITRCVGFEQDLSVDVYEMSVQPGDLFLLCSDGLSSLMEDQQIMEIAQKEFFEGGDLDKTVKALIAAANANGGDDNITTILVQILELEQKREGLT